MKIFIDIDKLIITKIDSEDRTIYKSDDNADSIKVYFKKYPDKWYLTLGAILPNGRTIPQRSFDEDILECIDGGEHYWYVKFTLSRANGFTLLNGITNFVLRINYVNDANETTGSKTVGVAAVNVIDSIAENQNILILDGDTSEVVYNMKTAIENMQAVITNLRDSITTNILKVLGGTTFAGKVTFEDQADFEGKVDFAGDVSLSKTVFNGSAQFNHPVTFDDGVFTSSEVNIGSDLSVINIHCDDTLNATYVQGSSGYFADFACSEVSSGLVPNGTRNLGAADKSWNLLYADFIESKTVKCGSVEASRVVLSNKEQSYLDGENILTASDKVELQSQIDGINAGQNLADIVSSYSDLNSYDTSKIKENDKVQVLVDEQHEDASTVYKWTGLEWSYIGEYGSNTYTKTEINSMFNSERLRAGEGIVISNDGTISVSYLNGDEGAY